MQLAQQACAICDASAKPLSDVAITQLLAELNQWQLHSDAGVNKLVKVYRCGNFNAALDQAQRIAQLADEHDHHPAILLEWGRLTVSWWTHSLNGLHKNDFIMAAKTDAALNP